MSKKKLILAGIIGRYPVGGVTWCALHYIAGFQRLGYDVFYLEDTGECGFDPAINGIAQDPSYALHYVQRELATVGLQSAWAYIDYEGRYHGSTRERVAATCREADLMVNLSGGCWFTRPEYDSVPKIFIDTDPGFTQLTIVKKGPGSYRDFLSSHRCLFTFGLKINDSSCRIAETPFQWKTTLQPLVLDFWPITASPPDAPYTAILSWRTDSFRDIGKGKENEILRIIDLPSKIRRPVLLAMGGGGPFHLLSQHGWQVTDAVRATIDPRAYRTFIQQSRAELGFAKELYVESRSGWFSDRTQCYLATGRPALVRDTGFSDVLPTGEGLLTYSNEEEILAGMETIEGNYDWHSRCAREIAAEHFSSDRILRDLLEAAGVA